MSLSNPTLEDIMSHAVDSLSLHLPPSVTANTFPHLTALIDSESTLAGYQLGVNCFLTFCANNSIPLKFTLPANEFLLCTFAAFEAGSRSGGTISNDLSGIRAWHILNGVPYQGSLRLSYTIHGAHRATPTDSKRPARPPITIDMLTLLHIHLAPTDPLDAVCLMVADCTTWGQARLGEFLPLSHAKFSPQYYISVSGQSRMLFLPWSKMACEQGEDLFLGHQHALCDPIASLENHLSINHLLPTSHLFAYRSLTGSLHPLTKCKFLSHCNDVWSQNGYPSISGHSFHIGGTTELLLRGIPPPHNAFLRYWCCLKQLAPLHAEMISPRISSSS
ncbi:hypothetical protein DEU56DRAFT_874312 [Suillus clintonianus]|uniref:uncharacterized protein n=1 Tax=Suillus clintonianus TaxID=1904413 RepID=UPI001B868E33|nr:uncharacterized protein DEU56DRAFT_874312 [Suillus clintonianus]KAG2114407.1 hypothetical protein DEU56DRAFT_874312 [Suillus clintonianus]